MGGREEITDVQGIRQSEGIGMYALHAVTPESATTSHYFSAQTHNFRIDDLNVTEALFHEIHTAFLEDLDVFAAQQEWVTKNPHAPVVSCRADRAQWLTPRSSPAC